MQIKLAIADDHPLATSGLRNMLSVYPDIDICASYNTGKELMEGLESLQPDVLLLDILFPDNTGDVLAGIISKAYPSIRILALTSLDTPMHVRKMLRQGCKGYLLKHTDQETLVQAIRTVARGEEFIEPSLEQQLFRKVLKGEPVNAKGLPELTRRELEVLRLLTAEYTNQEIAAKLFISLRTVENHRFSLMQKLGVNNSIGLIKAALELGIS